jgi:D-alanyl-D-alanine carboxypeptidase
MSLPRKKKMNPYVSSVLSALVTGIILAGSIVFIVQRASHTNRLAVLDSPGLQEEEPSVATPGVSFIEQGGRGVVKKRPILAQAYVVYDIASSTVIFEKESQRAFPIASLAKLATAEVSNRDFNTFTRIPITQKSLLTEGNTGHFLPDETFTARELLYPLLMVSSNDAAEAFARSYSFPGQNGTLGRKTFIQAMNDWAYSVGAYNTYFADPSGLSPQTVASALDVSTMIVWIYSNNPNLFLFLHTRTESVHTHIWVNPTHFLNLSSYLGGKNGYLPEAGETAVGIFNVNGRIYSIVVLGTKNRDQDVLELLSWITDSGKK